MAPAPTTANWPNVATEERAQRFGQQPATVLFSGLSGAGKSTLAYAVERKLFDLGVQCLYWMARTCATT